MLTDAICSVKATIERYKKACSDSSGAGSASEANAQVLLVPFYILLGEKNIESFNLVSCCYYRLEPN